jgi:hypothetical protein
MGIAKPVFPDTVRADRGENARMRNGSEITAILFMVQVKKIIAQAAMNKGRLFLNISTSLLKEPSLI